MQTRLSKPEVRYSYGAYNKFNNIEQRIRITEGCPHNCPYCYEPQTIKIFRIPKIVRNDVKILDMNILCKREALSFIKDLGTKRVDRKAVSYEFICGIDYRFLTQEIANALKKSRFKKLRIAWDWTMKDQYKMKDAVNMLINAGYKSKGLMIFMICNWKIPYEECCRKLDLCKIWNVKVADCYFDNQVRYIEPIHWTDQEIKKFRSKVRKHNQLVGFRIDPEIKNV